MVDVMVVGQGLAGTLLAHFLKQKGLSTIIIDDGHKTSSSRVAAGLINPVTGRKYVKSWMIDELIPMAIKTYGSLEELLDIKLISKRNIIRTIPDIRSENNWYVRQGNPSYQSYLIKDPSLGLFKKMIHAPFSFGEVTRSMQIDLSSLMTGFRKKYAIEIVTEEFNFEKLELGTKLAHLKYGDIKARMIVFCEGYRGIYNPLFNYLPFEGAKGEVLIIKIPGFRTNKILKHQVFLAPLGNERYWVGAGYAWDLSDINPTTQEKERLETILNKMLKVPFEIEGHIAGVRPSTKDRRPFLGRHPGHKNIFIFNGLGTKGSSLGPFWANKMSDFIVDDSPIPDEVNINRYLTLRS